MFMRSFTVSMSAVHVPTSPGQFIKFPSRIVQHLLGSAFSVIDTDPCIGDILLYAWGICMYGMKKIVLVPSTIPSHPCARCLISFPNALDHFSWYLRILQSWYYSSMLPVSSSMTAPANLQMSLKCNQWGPKHRDVKVAEDNLIMESITSIGMSPCHCFWYCVRYLGMCSNSCTLSWVMAIWDQFGATFLAIGTLWSSSSHSASSSLLESSSSVLLLMICGGQSVCIDTLTVCVTSFVSSLLVMLLVAFLKALTSHSKSFILTFPNLWIFSFNASARLVAALTIALTTVTLGWVISLSLKRMLLEAHSTLVSFIKTLWHL